MIFLRLFFEFFKIGLFSIGGGLATIPFLTELSGRTGWFTTEELANMIAVGESTPGPIGVNMATYVGFTAGSQLGPLAGILGSVIATLGLVVPSLLVILIIARILQKFRDNPLVSAAFSGLRPASMALIAAAGCSVLKVSLLNTELYAETGSLPDLFCWKALILAAVLFFCIRRFKKIHPIVWIGLSAAAGIVFRFTVPL